MPNIIAPPPGQSAFYDALLQMLARRELAQQFDDYVSAFEQERMRREQDATVESADPSMRRPENLFSIPDLNTYKPDDWPGKGLLQEDIIRRS